MTVYFVIWGIIGCIITNAFMAGDEGYNIWYIIVSILFGWVFGFFILLLYISKLLPKLLKPMFVKIGAWFEKWLD